MQNYTWGWRFSLGFACVFALLFFVGTVLAPDSPNSLLLNGKTAKATEVKVLEPSLGATASTWYAEAFASSVGVV